MFGGKRSSHINFMMRLQVILVFATMGVSLGTHASLEHCQGVHPFAGCKQSIAVNQQNCKHLAEANTPPLIFTKAYLPLCLGPREALIPFKQAGRCQIFDQNGLAKQCDNELLIQCLKKGYFPPPVWVVSPEQFGAITTPRHRKTPASDAEVCLWYGHGKGPCPHQGVNHS